jgi:hypothetical protein
MLHCVIAAGACPRLRPGEPQSRETGVDMNKINAQAESLMKPDSKIGVLVTEDDMGYPHLTFISSIQGLGDDKITFGKFSVGISKDNLEVRPDAAFLVLTADMQWLKGNATYTHNENTGPEVDEYNNKPLFRYNTYFGFDHVYYLDLKNISDISKLEMPKIVIGAILSRFLGAFVSKSDKKILSHTSKSLFAQLDGLKFIAWKKADGNLDIIPIIQAGPAGTDRISFSHIPYGKEIAQIPKGAKVGIFYVNMQMQSVLTKGIYRGSKCGTGIMDIEYVYNSMPPKMEYIYPRNARIEAVSEF